jgi:hypothetical protein
MEVQVRELCQKGQAFGTAKEETGHLDADGKIVYCTAGCDCTEM